MPEFDLKEDEHHALAQFIGSSGWTEFVMPKIRDIASTLYTQMLDPSKKRKDLFPDDYLRGQIAAYKFMLEWPAKRAKMLQNQITEAARNAAVNDGN